MAMPLAPISTELSNDVIAARQCGLAPSCYLRCGWNAKSAQWSSGADGGELIGHERRHRRILALLRPVPRAGMEMAAAHAASAVYGEIVAKSWSRYRPSPRRITPLCILKIAAGVSIAGGKFRRDEQPAPYTQNHQAIWACRRERNREMSAPCLSASPHNGRLHVKPCSLCMPAMEDDSEASAAPCVISLLDMAGEKQAKRRHNHTPTPAEIQESMTLIDR